MEPIFAAQANRLARTAPIGRVSRAVSDHEVVGPVAPAEPVHPPTLDGRRHPHEELVTVGPLGDAYEGLDGQLHPVHPEPQEDHP